MDTVDPGTRSRIMASVRSKDTGLEEKFIELLNAHGIDHFALHPTDITGNPDIVFHEHLIAIFVDSCFWHGCPNHLRRPNSNRAYWDKKIDGNVCRDRRKRAALRREGWSVLRVWEHDLKRPDAAIARIGRAIGGTR